MLVLFNVRLVLLDFLYILSLNNNKKIRVPNNMIVGSIICEVGTIMCDIGIINMRFYLLKVSYLYGYCRITPSFLVNYKLLLSFEFKKTNQKTFAK